MTFFEDLIRDLGNLMGASLHAERGYLCKLLIEGSFHIQIEHEPEKASILLASFICEIPPGRIREDILKEGLKANGLLDRKGIFAYSSKNNHLVYFAYIPDNIHGNKLYEETMLFIDTIKKWKSAIESGQLTLISSNITSPSSPFMR